MASSKNVLKEILPEVLAARDILERDERRRVMDMQEALAEEEARRAYMMRHPELHNPLPSEPVEIKEKNVLTDPKSWLNTGLKNLAGNAASVILGEPSGNNVVDMGVANVPGVGAGAIFAAGGMPGIVDVVPGAAEAKSAVRGGMKAGKRIFKAKKLPHDEYKKMYDKVGELADRWIYAKTSVGEDPLDWYGMSRNQRNEWLQNNGIDISAAGLPGAMDKYLAGRYNSERIEGLLGRDIAELAPEKKAYTAPYSVTVEPPGGTSRILTGPVPEEPVEEAAKVLVNPITGEVETEAERAARRQALLERAAATRARVGGKRKSANEAVKKSQAKKKAAAAEAEKQAVIERNRATIAEMEALKAERKAAGEAEKAARTNWSVNTPGGTWDASRHQLGENGFPTGTTYRKLLGEAGDTPENRRAAYVLDSLASVAARTIQPKGIDNPSMKWNDRRHLKTTYDDAMNRFYDEVEANRKTGNLPDVPGIAYEPRKIRWGLNFKSRDVDEPLVLVDGIKESLYDALFRKKAYSKVNEILKGR